MSATDTLTTVSDLHAPGEVTAADQRAFVLRLAVIAVLAATGVWLTRRPGIVPVASGVLLLAVVYCHAVELQHQCLHRVAFRRTWMHRVVGVPLGLPLLVAYSHYRARHLQHHRYLGTDKDAEFFGFDATQPLTWSRFAKALFDYRRQADVLVSVARSVRGSWRYTQGTMSERSRRTIVVDYRVIAAFLGVMLALTALGAGHEVLVLWLLPFVVAVPIHFLIELPEHILCDSTTTEVLRNTRSITGSWFSTWLTNGNNLHIEHHLSMTVPLTRLRPRHRLVQRKAEVVDRSYFTFYRDLFRSMSTTRDVQCSTTT
ncbi:MAG: fatty acid desaturase [Acidimicrobiia bacterium]|nr:fatty acid desaturase [Acidimicrobiia bacterium]